MMAVIPVIQIHPPIACIEQDPPPPIPTDQAVGGRKFIPGPIPAWRKGLFSTPSQWGLGELVSSTSRKTETLALRFSPIADQEAPLFDLPVELMDMLIDSLSLDSIRDLRTCRALNAFLDRNSIWQRFYKRDFPQCQRGEKQTFQDAYKNTHILLANLARGIFAKRKLLGNEGKVNAFTVRKGILISAGPFIRFWDMQTGEQLGGSTRLIGKINCIAASGDQYYAGGDGGIYSWGKGRFGIEFKRGRSVAAIVILEDTRFLPHFIEPGCKIVARNLKNKIQRDRFSSEEHSGPITAMIGAGQKVFSGSQDSSIKIWNAETLDCLHTLTGHTRTVHSLALRGMTLISGSEDKSIKLWDIASGACVHTFAAAHQHTVDFLAVTRGMLVSGSSKEHRFKIWNLDKKLLVKEYDHPEFESCAFLAEGKLYVANDWGAINVWDFKAGDVEIFQEIAAVFRTRYLGQNTYLEELNRFLHMPKAKRQKIYEMLERLKPSLQSKGEEAFHDENDQQATRREKASAIEFYLAEDLGYEYRKL